MKKSLLALCVLTFALRLNAETTESILARMNELSMSFKGMSTKVTMTTYTKVIDDKSVESGSLEMQHWTAKDTRILLKLSGQSDSHIVFLADDMVRLYTPKLKLVKNYRVGKNSDLVYQFLLLGFGSSGKELVESYEINNAGSEKIGGQDTTHLVLVPKADKVKEKIAKVEIWIPVGKAYPVQQQFFEPNGNYRTTTYGEMTVNPPMKKKLEFKLPSGTKEEN